MMRDQKPMTATEILTRAAESMTVSFDYARSPGLALLQTIRQLIDIKGGYTPTQHAIAEFLRSKERDAVKRPFQGGATSPTDTMAEKAKKPALAEGFFQYFPNAMLGVTKVSAMGAKKHGGYGGWKKYPLTQYENATDRHRLAIARGEVLDIESGYPHRWHKAWNALAEAELAYDEDVKLSEETKGWLPLSSYAPGDLIRVFGKNMVVLGKQMNSKIREKKAR